MLVVGNEQAVRSQCIFFLFVCKIVTTRASPAMYTTGYLQGRTQI